MFITPQREHGIVYRREGSIYGYNGWPSVCRTDDGRLISVCSGYRMQHICPFGKTVMNISSDEGKTWSAPIIVNDSPLDDRDAGVVNLGGNKLLVTWFVHPADVYENVYRNAIMGSCSDIERPIAAAQLDSFASLDEEQRKGGSYIKLSDDGGMSWSERIRVPVSSPHGPSLLSDGTLLYLGKEMYSYGALEDGVIAAYSSKDGGHTWEKLAQIEIPEGCGKNNMHEPHVIELPDGRLFGAIRAEGLPQYRSFTIYTCWSDDRGKTWTTPRSTGISGSPPHLMVHSSGALIMSFGRREVPFGERALVSYDGGETWKDEYNIDDRADGGDLGYPASVELPDGSIFTLYYQRAPKDVGYDAKTSILYTRWKL